jgi:hypothetical protein
MVVDLLIPEALPPEASSLPLKRGLVYPITISVSARHGVGNTFSPPLLPRMEHGTRRNRRQDRSPSSQPHPSGNGSEASTRGPRAPVHSRLGPKVTCTVPTTKAAHATDPKAHVASDSPLPHASSPVPNACPSPDGIDVEDRCGIGNENSIQAPMAVTAHLLSPLLQQTKRGEHGGPQGDCSKPMKDGSDGALPKVAHFFRAPDGDCE